MLGWLGGLWYDLGYSLTIATLTGGFSLRWSGSRHVPRTGPALLLANHESFIDPLAVGCAATSRRLSYLARKTLFDHRLFGALLRSWKVYPVDQDGVATEGLKTVLRLLGQGEAVLIFPEGERSLKGEMQPLKPGVSLLVRRAAPTVPVIPVGVAGAYEAYPRGAKWPSLCPLFLPATPTGGVFVSVGAPTPAGSYAGLGREEMLRRLFDAIREQQVRAEALRRR